MISVASKTGGISTVADAACFKSIFLHKGLTDGFPSLIAAGERPGPKAP